MESDSDHEEDMNSPQRPKFPKARTGNEPGMYGGFGGDGPSQAWLKAKGYIKSHFEGGSGRLDEETSVVEVRPVENDDKAKRDEERRQKMLARFESGKKQEPEMWEKAVVKKEIVLTEAEKDRRRRLAEKREFGLVMSKFALEETNKIPEIEPPKQRIISPEEERKRELLTQ